MASVITMWWGILLVFKSTKLFGICDFPVANDSVKVVIIIIYYFYNSYYHHFALPSVHPIFLSVLLLQRLTWR